MKLTKDDGELIKKAEKLWKTKYVSKKHSVSAVLVSKKENTFEGMSMEFNCGVATCAERTAMFKMMPDETGIKTMVAVYKNKIIPPCGVCRELMYEMNKENLKDAWIIISRKKKVRLGELFPYPWEEAF